ncbi:glycosyltransferase family 2 protein [Snuella sedimenti]|uniref:Glycosyltransferase family 2 protein n=1 Tax=Snuella sedimenti TaxID=2798802 RepID=A0A8J7JB56_9FLAO|nr:glycosyltransferase family 2 protein [Snuella sedimenti]MBJ6367849.1 glycosyltransferase family 2 protein [Snuella sedimenti]
MKLSIVILNYNVRYFLELCLKSVQEAVKGIDAEIIVVDNDSSDNSCDMVKQLFPDVVLIKNASNYGFSKANNIGVSKAKGDYVCVLNPDTVVPEDIFIKLLDFSKTKEQLGIVGCKLIDGSGRYLPESKRNVPFLRRAFKKLLGSTKDYYANQLCDGAVGKVDVLVGAFMFMKRELYVSMGGFDEDYFMYGEDIDLSYKVLRSGFHNYYYGNATVIHFKGESTIRDKFYTQRFYGAMQIFYEKHFKRNLLFDMFVWLGIKIACFFGRLPKAKKIKQVGKYILMSNKLDDKLQAVLSKEVVLALHLKGVDTASEVIFDANVLSYKEVINMMENGSESKYVTYKILPKKANFVLGSDNAISKGEVILF